MSDYHQLTIRVPDDVVGLLTALAGALRQPRWRVVTDALRAYAGEHPSLDEAERRAVRTVLRLHEKGAR